MKNFENLKALIKALSNNLSLVNELFEKRNLRIRLEDALPLVDEKEDRIHYLKEKGVVQQNGDYLELDERFTDFFEQVLEVNVEINTAFIRESVEVLQNNINYYLEEKSAARKNSYLRKVKTELKKITKSTWRNVLDLRRNIEDTYKTEPNYKIKLDKLRNYDKKAVDIKELIQTTENLCFEKEKLFFTQATDEELNRIKRFLRVSFREAWHQLIEIEKQAIDYINQTRKQSRLIEKLKKIKFLKDRFELKEYSNVNSVIRGHTALLFEQRTVYPVKLALNDLQQDETRDLVKKAQQKARLKQKIQREPAGDFTAGELKAEQKEEAFVDHEAIKNSFVASGRDLMGFLTQYPLPGNPGFAERLNLYCQLVALFPDEIDIYGSYRSQNGVEYALAYPAE